MKQETFDKANDLQNEIFISSSHLDTIDSAIKRGQKLTFIMLGCGSREIELDVTDIQPIDTDGYFNQYRSNLVAKIAKLKKQFAAL